MGASNFGGSILPSHDPSLYGRRAWAKGGDLEIIPVPQAEEHLLVMHTINGPSVLAMHPNAYSLAKLRDHMIAGERARAEHQLRHITSCGGLARTADRFIELMEAE